eukprot:13324706-Ditylum_brightwellii.AAC.1
MRGTMVFPDCIALAEISEGPAVAIVKSCARCSVGGSLELKIQDATGKAENQTCNGVFELAMSDFLSFDTILLHCKHKVTMGDVQDLGIPEDNLTYQPVGGPVRRLCRFCMWGGILGPSDC